MTAQAPAPNAAPTTTQPATAAPTVADIAAHTDKYNASRFAPKDVAEVWRLAKGYYRARILPSAYYNPSHIRGDTDEAWKAREEYGVSRAVAAILLGAEFGMLPGPSLRNVYFFDGNTYMSAAMLEAICRKHPLCTSWRVVKTTTTECIIRTTRYGDDEPIELRVTLEDYKHLHGKNNWQLYPRPMLLARCRAELARMVYPDIVGGLYASEEIGDIRDNRPGVPIDDQTAAILAMGDEAEEAPAEPPPAAEPKAMELPLPTPAARPVEAPVAAPITQAEREQLGAIIADKSGGVATRLHRAQYLNAVRALDVHDARKEAMIEEIKSMLARAK